MGHILTPNVSIFELLYQPLEEYIWEIYTFNCKKMLVQLLSNTKTSLDKTRKRLFKDQIAQNTDGNFCEEDLIFGQISHVLKTSPQRIQQR